MSDTDFKIPNSLKEALEAGEVVPFIGAGVSMSIKKFPLEAVRDENEAEQKDKDGNIIYKSLFPSWKGYVEILVKALNGEGKPDEANLVEAYIKSAKPKYLEAMQHAFDELPKSIWFKKLNEYFRKDENEAAKDSLELAKLIWQLGSNLIFTTNIDRVLEWKSVKDSSIEQLNRQNVEAAELQADKNPPPTIFYLHGRVGDNENIVFTRQQYDDFYKNNVNEAKLRTLQNFLTTKSFLFIGFSLDDAYFVEELKNIREIYKGGTKQYYALIKKSDAGKLKEFDFVTEVYFEDFGEPLLKIVREMRDIAAKVNTDKITSPPPENKKSSDKKSFFNIPFGSKGAEFVGRKGKIEDIWQQLNKDGCASIGQAVSVKGFGGLGKTQLAVEFAHDKRGEYKNGVFWMVADQPIDVQLLTIGDELGWTANVSETVNQLDAAKDGFRSLSDCLILFDNVESYGEIKDYLPKADAQTHILITSRERISQFHNIDLELLNRNESRELLLKIAKREPNGDAEKEHLEKILEILGDIPLAVELVGGYFAEHELITFEKYHQFLDEVPLDKLEKEFPEGSFTNHDRSIIKTLRISEKTIKEKPLMVKILKVLAWSGSSSMGISLLKDLVEAETDFEFENALNDAHKLRLLKKDEDGERFVIHRLLAKVIQYENPLEAQNEWHKEIVNSLENWFTERENKFENLAEFEAEIEHLESWQEQTFRIIPAESIFLLKLRGNIPKQRGLYQKALNFFNKGLNLYEKEKLTDKSLLANIQNDIGFCHRYLGDQEEALKYQLQSLELYRQIFGENTAHTAILLNNVGATYGDLGKHEEALKYKLQSLEIRRQIFSENNPYIASSLNNVGYTYGQLGKHEEALKYQLQSLELYRQIFGENHPYTALSLNNIGLTYGDLGKDEKALKYQLQSLEIHQKLLGTQHPTTIIFAGNVILRYLNLGDKEKAGRKAAEFFDEIPQNHRYWQLFEEISRPYR